MNLVESLRIALRALAANKGRSALTMLGVIIGVSAVILLVAIGTGVQTEILGTIEGLGSNLLFAFPVDMSSGGEGGGMGGSNTGLSVRKQFELEDAERVAEKLGDSALVVPVIQAPGVLKVGNRTLRTSLAGGSPDGDQVFTADLAAGRHYTRGEYVGATRVTAIGWTVAKELFPNQDPVGKTMSVNGQRFTVVGYYKPMGGGTSGDRDNQIYLPATTAQRVLNTRSISMIVAKAEDPADIELVRARMRSALRPRFGQDLSVFSQDQTLGMMSQVLGTLTVMLAGIAGISLLVGGIGIMNIMLVSVSERTREIGIRKAVGARTHDIMSQFIIEAVVLSLIGGGLGIAVGWGGAAVLVRWVPTQVTAWAVALAFTFSAAVGVFFGVYPAWKASRLDPIEALRYE